MLIPVYVLSVLVWLVFERQARRHLFYESLEYQRIGKEPPQAKPKLPLLESWLNITIGIFLLLIGVMAILAQLLTLRDLPDEALYLDDIMFASVFIATGITLILLGLKSVRYHKNLSKKMRTN